MPLTEAGRRALILRKQTSKTSDLKLDRIRDCVSLDGRLRDQFSFMGSARCGRWSGRAVQLHNLPRPVKAVEKNLQKALDLLQRGDYTAVAREFENPLEVVASCIRSMFQAPAGKRLVVCDLNAIENRVLGWLARSDSILSVFKEGRCPYLSFALDFYASELFEMGITTFSELDAIHEAGKKDKTGNPVMARVKQMRQDSKPPVLGAGYRLGGGDELVTDEGDRIRTGLWGYARNMGVELTREDAHRAVEFWRADNPEVAGWVHEGESYPSGGLWRDLEHEAFETMKTGEPQEAGRCVFQAFGPRGRRKMLRITLPSGRGLHYIRPLIEDVEFMGRKKPTLTYEGLDQTKKTWTRLKTQGGKLTENIDQGTARDILLNGMFLAEERGLEVVAHVHDELICMVDEASPLGLADLRECMTTPPAWAPDLPLGADGYEGQTYKKG